MDPMDYAFNHASASEAPYHIPVSSYSSSWMTYGSGTATTTGLDPFYVPPDPAPANLSSQETPIYGSIFRQTLAQSGPLPWPSGLLQSTTSSDHHGRSISENTSTLITREATNLTARPSSPRAWPVSTTSHQLPRLPTRSDQETSRGPGFPTSTARSNHMSPGSYAAAKRAFDTFDSESSGLGTSRMPSRRQSWRASLLHDADETPAGLLPPLRSQASLQSDIEFLDSTLSSLQHNSSSSSHLRLRPSGSQIGVQQRQSSLGRRADENLPISPLSPSFANRADRVHPSSRPHRASRANVLDIQRPISISADVGSSSRPHSTVSTTGGSSGVAALSPRRQRPSRAGPRRNMAHSRSPIQDYGRTSIDRSLVSEFLADHPTEKLTGYRVAAFAEILYRELRVMEGTMGQEKIARRSMLKSLEVVALDDLPDADKACTICYEPYGVISPEGVREEALRLPDCKHVFGSHCLKTWLDDSAKCPYCRKKLPSEPKWLLPAMKQLWARLNGAHNDEIEATVDNETFLAVTRGYDRGGLQPSPIPSTAGRAPRSSNNRQQDSEEQPRRAHVRSGDQGDGPTAPMLISGASLWRATNGAADDPVTLLANFRASQATSHEQPGSPQ
jgi:hypothetical protein